MEIVVTAFAAVVAAGCFVAILKSDLKELHADGETSEKIKNNS
jgi:hypothetical protein